MGVSHEQQGKRVSVETQERMLRATRRARCMCPARSGPRFDEQSSTANRLSWEYAAKMVYTRICKGPHEGVKLTPEAGLSQGMASRTAPPAKAPSHFRCAAQHARFLGMLGCRQSDRPRCEAIGMEQLLLSHWRAPGDIVCMTAPVRDLVLTHPGRYEVHIAGSHSPLWAANPHVAGVWGPRPPGNMRRVRLSCRGGLLQCDGQRLHYVCEEYVEQGVGEA